MDQPNTKIAVLLIKGILITINIKEACNPVLIVVLSNIETTLQKRCNLISDTYSELLLAAQILDQASVKKTRGLIRKIVSLTDFPANTAVPAICTIFDPFHMEETIIRHLY